MRYRLVIPAWNEADFLGATLAVARAAMDEVAERARARGASREGELVVVDNNSTDDTAKIARAGGATVVFEPVNRIASARNAGARGAAGEALVFVDADTHVSAPLLGAALERLAAGRTVGGGSTIAPDRPVSGAARAGLELWNRIGRTMRLAAGCFVFARRDAFEAVGGFDERVYAGEEIFLSRALKRWGRARGLAFEVLDVAPIETSVRKLDWYSPAALARQAAVVFLPGALRSRRLTRTWYDDRGAAGERRGP